MNPCRKNILLIGYGNPGRLDDGLGPALVAKLEARSIQGLAVEADYQLVVEHAFEIANYECVIFADSSVNGDAPFRFVEIHAAPAPNFHSHSLTPEAVLFLAKTVFRSKSAGYVLAIRGYEFNGFGERLSEQAAINLEAAFEFILEVARSGNMPGIGQVELPGSSAP